MKRDASGKFVSNWGSETKQRVSLSLTSTAWRSLDEEAQKRGISRSEVIEQLARSFGSERHLDSGEIPQNALLQEQINEQQQTIALLRRQKQELEALLENAPDAIARFDSQIRYLYVNRVVEQALGFSRDALLGKTMSEFMSDPIYRLWEKHLRLVFATAQKREIEFEFETPFGVRFYQARLVPELDDRGTPISVIVISRDMTATRQAEQQRIQLIAAQETERKAVTILESITDAFVAFDRNWNYTYVNQAAAQILHKTPEELIGKHIWNEVFPNLVGGVTYKNLHRAVAEQVPTAWEEFEQVAPGWLEVNAYPSDQGVAIYFRDITERKQALAERERLLQELETERTRFEAVLRQMPAGVMIADAVSGKLVLANEQAKQIVGYAYEQLLELNEYDPLVSYTPLRSDGQPYIHLDMPLARSLKTGEVVTNEEMEIRRDDGSCIFININSAPILDNQGQIVAAVVIFQDVTKRKLVEQALRQSESQLRGLFNANLIGIIVGNSQGYILEVNDAWLNIVGYTREEVLSGDVNFLEITPPEFRHLDRQAMVEMKQFGCHTPFEKEYIRKDGTRVPVLIGTAYIGEPDNLEIGFLIDLTERKQIETEREELLKHLQQKERQQQFLIELNDAIRTIQDPKAILWQVVRATGQHFKVTRCTYGEIDPTQEYVIVDRDFCNGTISVVGRHHMNSFGSEIIAQLKQGKTIVVDNVDVDPRTADSGVAAFNAIQTKSLLCVPLVKEERFVALFVLHHVSPRHWTEEEVALMEQIAEQTWLAVERTRAEESLRESEAHLQLAVKVGRMGTWDWDVQTGALLWSEGHYSVLGLEPYVCEPSYEVWANRVHPEDLAQTEAKLQQAMLEKKEYHHEYRMRWLDGSIHWVEARGKFTYDSGGNAKRSIGAVIDITERKQAEQEREQLLERERIARTQVEAAQRQLATIFETSPVGIAWLDTEQRFIAINEALAEINGLTREQHLGHSIPELFGQSDAKLVEVFHQIYTTGNPFISPNFAVNVPGRDDRRPGYYNVYYLPTTSPNHKVEGVLVYVIDVTERVRLERAQRFLSETSAVLASSLDYQTTLERVAQLTVPELADWCTIHMVEEDGSIEQITVAHTDPVKLQWADQIRRKYPLNPDAPRGAAFTLRTGRSDLLPDIPDELLVQAARDPEHLEILRQVGSKSVMTAPLRSQANIIGVISFIFAESGRRYDRSYLQLAEELAHRASLAIENAQLYRVAQRARAKAESANRVKDEFLAVLSHELRSPLNPILGWTKMLRSKRLDATKVEQALETIERNAKLQAQLIEDLLDVSRILQGKMTLNVAPVNLAATIQAAKETVRLAAEVKSIQIHTTLNPVSGTVLGDTNRIQQIVWNLLSNAVKFTSNGGRVEVQLEQVGTYAQIQVKDTGIGISPEFLPHVFEYFRQEDGTTTRRFGGLGLGLAIVRHLTELHGGTVQAVSPGQNLGATFTIRLPLNAVEEEVSSDNSEQESVTRLTGIQILVVDDDADMRELAEFILTQAGAQVTTAASGAQALALLNQSIPKLLLCDIGMPEMDGYSLIRLLRKWSPQQGGTIPAIALTAYAGEINQQQALAAGFMMHISKPVEPEKLVQAIAQLLDSIGHSGKSIGDDVHTVGNSSQMQVNQK